MCTWESQVLWEPRVSSAKILQQPQFPNSQQKTTSGVTGQREQQGPYQVEGLMGVLESQEHVLEDTQGGSPHDGVQQLRENLKKSSCPQT